MKKETKTIISKLSEVEQGLMRLLDGISNFIGELYKEDTTQDEIYLDSKEGNHLAWAMAELEEFMEDVFDSKELGVPLNDIVVPDKTMKAIEDLYSFIWNLKTIKG